MANSEVQQNKMILKVVSPYEVFYEGEVDRVVIPASDGQFGILPGHSPYVVALMPGITRFDIGEEKKSFVISEGYAEVARHTVLIVCNAAEWPESIDTERAEQALERATKRYNSVTSTEEQRFYAKHAILRAKARIQIAAERNNCKSDRK
ncbi:MAG: ATP synthase F1 subunit epsilon [Clostridiales bacterium]|nr:ATP synthase F1 subunit epsilon [Candidatus Scatonaster coprocaballi]